MRLTSTNETHISRATSYVLGAKLHAKAEVTGNQGTVLHVEMYEPDKVEDRSPGSIGVAKHAKGNIHKVAF